VAITMKSRVSGRRRNISNKCLVRDPWASCAFVVTQVQICRVSRGVVRDLVCWSFILLFILLFILT